MPDISSLANNPLNFLPANLRAQSLAGPKDICLSPDGSVGGTPSKDQLAKTCQDFEAVLVNYLLKTMRESVPKDGFLDEGNDVEFYRGLMDWEIATKASRQDQFGLWKTMYRQLAGHDPDLMPEVGSEPTHTKLSENNEISGGPHEVRVEGTADYFNRRAGSGSAPVSTSQDPRGDDTP